MPLSVLYLILASYLYTPAVVTYYLPLALALYSGQPDDRPPEKKASSTSEGSHTRGVDNPLAALSLPGKLIRTSVPRHTTKGDTE